MRKSIIAVMLLAACLTSCQTVTVPTGPWIKKVDSEEASRLVIGFSAEMKKVHHLDLEDSRMAYDDDIQRFYIEYSSQRLLTLYEARLLMVEVVEEFLRRINNHTVLSFELNKFPLTANDLGIKINFESFYGLYVDPLYIGTVWLKCGCVHFIAFDRKDQNIDWSHERYEPYFKSRELALIKREVDLPDVEAELAPAKPSSYIYDRYEPENP